MSYLRKVMTNQLGNFKCLKSIIPTTIKFKISTVCLALKWTKLYLFPSILAYFLGYTSVDDLRSWGNNRTAVVFFLPL
jgi:hypothetical protein